MNIISKSLLIVSIILLCLNTFISISGFTDSSIDKTAKLEPASDNEIKYYNGYSEESGNSPVYWQPFKSTEQAMTSCLKDESNNIPSKTAHTSEQEGEDIASAIVINSLPYYNMGTTSGFNDDYDYECYYVSAGSPDVVYSYTPDSNEVIYVSLCDSKYDTKLWVFENSVSGRHYCNEDVCGLFGLQSAVWNVELYAGNTYYIIIDGYDGDYGDYGLYVDYFEQPVLECPPDAIPEGEPTGCDYPDITNGGCWSNPIVFGSINCGETICGTAGNFKYDPYYYKDTDWYEFIITEDNSITFTIQAEFAVHIGVSWTDPAGSGECEDWTGYLWPSANAAPGEETSVFANLAPGTYWLFISPAGFLGAPCDGKYIVDMSCSITGVTCPPGAIPEEELSGCEFPDTTNGGCWWDIPRFSNINPGDTVCGTMGMYYNTEYQYFSRDVDCYMFEVTEVTTVTWSVTAEFPINIELVYTNPLGSSDCADYSGHSGKYGPPFETVSLSRSLSPGIYWIQMHSAFWNSPMQCNSSYIAGLTFETEIDPTLGRCCYGDPEFPECDNLSLYNCWGFLDFISWDSLSDCTEPCEIAQTGSCCYGTSTWQNCIDEIQADCENRNDFISWSAEPGCADPCIYYYFSRYDIFSGSFRDMDAIDLDQDNNLDLVVTDYYPEGRWNMRIAFGGGDGTFESPIKVLTNYDIFTFAFIDNDDLIDIVALGYKNSIFHNSMAVLINQGDRSFSTSYYQHYHNEFVSSTGMAVGYFNDDAFVDIAAPPNKVYFGNNEGTFDEFYSATLPSACYSVDIGDFNNDGFDDIIGISNTNQAEIYTSDGAGNFTETGNFDLPYWTVDVTTAKSVADYNHDGNIDVAAVVNEPGGRSFILIGFGDGLGAISQVKTLAFEGSSFYLVAADVNRDNSLDLIASDFQNNALQIYYGDEQGNFSEHIMADIGSGLAPTYITAGDFDRDGNPDFITGYRQNGNILTSSAPLRLLINNLPDAPVLEDQEMMMVTTGFDNVSIEITNPDMFNISRNYATIAGSDYWRFDYDNNGEIDETAIDYNLQYGEYEIKITPRDGADPNGEFTAAIRIDGTQMATIFHDYQLSHLRKGSKDIDEEIIFYYEVEEESSIQPPNGAASDPQPTFDWSGLLQKYPGAESYNFQISPYYDFSNSINEITDISEASVTLDYLLGYDSVFYWRVQGSSWADFSRTFAVYISDDATNIIDVNDDAQSKLPSVFRLYQNYPNPFNSFTNISFNVPHACDNIKLEIYNILGRKIITLIDGPMDSGIHTINWDGNNSDGNSVSSGIYFYRIETEDFVRTHKMILLK